MGYSDASNILSERLSRFRDWTYAELAADLGRMSADSKRLESVNGKCDDGGEYQVTIDVWWNDRPGGNIRVAGDITTDEMTRVYGLPSSPTPDACEDFIMAADSTFIGE